MTDPVPPDPGRLSRREFTRRASLAGAAVAAASWVGLTRHRLEPPAHAPGAPAFRFAD